MANQLITLDLAAVEWTNQIVKGHIKDGELQVYDVQINENRIPKDLTAFKTGQFRGTNYNGEFVAKDIAVTAKDGKFTFKFPKTAFSVAGNFKQAYFVFTDSTGGQVSTEDFNILVLPDADADATHADALVDEYNKYVKQLQDSYNNAKAGWDKQIADLKNKIAELKAAIDKLDFYTKSQADNRFLITNVGTIGADTDWNTANSEGIYMVNAAKGANCPTGTTPVWGNLVVLKVGETIRQTFLGATTGGVDYTRSYSGSPATWGKWYTIITDTTSANWQMQKIFKDNDFALATCPKGTDFGDFLKSNSVPVGFSIIRDNNTAINAMVIKENNNYIYAYSGGPSNDFERFSINNGVASGWMRSLNTNDIVSAKLTPTGGATDPCVMTVIGETLVNLQFNGRYPTKGGQAIYWIDAKYAPKSGVSFAIPHNNIEGTQMVITIGSNGAVILVGNSDDKSTAFGSYAYNCKV